MGAVAARTAPTLATGTPVETVAAVAVALATTLHDRQGAFAQRLDAQRHVAQDILVDPHVAFHLVPGGRRRVDVQQDVIILAVIFHLVSVIPEAPVPARLISEKRAVWQA